MPVAKVHRISAAAPDDVSGIEAAIAAGRIDPQGVMAVLGKTEGNGLVNDYARGYASYVLSLLFQRHLPKEQADKICLVMSGGTEGGMAPHWTVFERAEGNGGTGPALAIGRSHTAALPPEHLGRPAQIDAVASAVRVAMADANIVDVRDVHFVQVKCPLLTVARIGRSRCPRAERRDPDTLKSMGLSRAASALGVAVALGEIERSRLERRRYRRRTGLSCRAARVAPPAWSCSVMKSWCFGMSKSWSGPLVIDHAVMADAIDIEPVRSALGRLGFKAPGQLATADRDRLVAVLAKAEASHDGLLRGTVTPCWTIPIFLRHGTPGPLSAARWRAWSAMRKSTCPAVPNIRARTAAGRWR